jgi:restriction system protein
MNAEQANLYFFSRSLEWKRFEDVVAAYSRELGYEAKTTRIGADGGVDVQLFQNGQSQPVMIIQCKAWDAYKVGVKPVRELFGVMAADKVANGAFFTTGDFTAEAEDWARDKNIDLVNGREFISRIGQLPATTPQSLLRVATEGDFTTPTCPSCGIKMVVRVASKGRSEGNRFWGCPNFPRGCKQTFKIS